MAHQGMTPKTVGISDYVFEWRETLRQGWRDARAGREFHDGYETANVTGQNAYERGRLLGIIIGGNCTHLKMVRGLHEHAQIKNPERLIR